VVIFF